ncbi:GNAT family N-acetyltransferase [Oceanobacillus halophilus]|uniref:N-acetyltransferase n=1 Tax=Oceanobacillus halophilus TaxID=930130 RepID=A0A494ZWI7_9BACI|nr:GNAT family N-acetyltransferase [Oceanobacillus halophilus]RKQ30796.1 N-acetyltransferase [Oceanobacillus halophilus]
MIELKEDILLENEEIKRLYDDAQWTAYTNDMQKLIRAIQQSLKVVTAWHNNTLVGLIRAVGDGETILYIQDILVLKEYQRYGIGSQLMRQMLSSYENVRQKVLLTEEAKKVRAFYEKHGFNSCDKGTLVSFAKMD